MRVIHYLDIEGGLFSVRMRQGCVFDRRRRVSTPIVAEKISPAYSCRRQGVMFSQAYIEEAVEYGIVPAYVGLHVSRPSTHRYKRDPGTTCGTVCGF